MPDLTSLGHVNIESSARQPGPLYTNLTGRRIARLVPVPAIGLFLLTFGLIYFAAGTLQDALLGGAVIGGLTGVVMFVAVKVAVLPRAKLNVYERIFETKSPRLKHQGMHIVSVETRGSYVFITMETGEIHAVLTGEPEKAKLALLELRKRARET